MARSPRQSLLAVAEAPVAAEVLGGVAELGVGAARAHSGAQSPGATLPSAHCCLWLTRCAHRRNNNVGNIRPRDIKISFSAKGGKQQQQQRQGGRGRGAKRQGIKQQAANRNTGRGRAAARGRQLSQASRKSTLAQRRGQQQKKTGSLSARFGAAASPKAKAGRGRGRATGRGAGRGRGRATGRGASRGRGGRKTGQKLRML